MDTSSASGTKIFSSVLPTSFKNITSYMFVKNKLLLKYYFKICIIFL